MQKLDQRLTWRHFVDCPASEEYCSYDLGEVGEFLKTEALPGACTSLAMVDGFLTALVIGLDFPCKENEGVELVLGDTSNKRMKGGWTKKEWRMFDAVCARGDAIYYYLEHDRAKYEPLIGREYGNGEVPIVEWCRGFVKFFNLCPQVWAPIFEVEIGRTLMAPLIYFGTDGGWTRKIAEKYEVPLWCQSALAEHLPHYVFTIKDFFLTPWFIVDMEALRDIVAPYWDIPKTVDGTPL